MFLLAKLSALIIFKNHTDAARIQGNERSVTGIVADMVHMLVSCHLPPPFYAIFESIGGTLALALSPILAGFCMVIKRQADSRHVLYVTKNFEIPG